jgi:Cof subfamily protein (haloacid dehalogenase superfamily)
VSLRYELLVVDIDGTLVGPDNQITPPVRTALTRAHDAGVKVVLATGRRYRRALPHIEELGFATPVITNSGALVKHPTGHKTLHVAQFKPPVLGRLLDLFADDGREAVVFADTYHTGKDMLAPNERAADSWLDEFLQMNAPYVGALPCLMQTPPADVIAAIAMGPHDEMLRLGECVDAELNSQVETHVLRSPRYRGHMCEVTPAGVTKWSAILQLADAWGIPTTAICAVGDDVNDESMIRCAGLGVAMQNAEPSILNIADRIAPSVDDDGLVTLVDWLLEDSVRP